MKDPVRDAREELKRAGLTAQDPSPDVVPGLIARSWRRSISSNAASELPTERFREIDTESILCRAAEPVLDRWQHQLTDTGTTLFVSDRAGSIVSRRSSDRSTQRRLDRANAAEGFDYSEQVAGTNGLGTAIVENRPVLVQGAHHFNELLSDITCAAVPLCTPAGSVIGAVSLGGLSSVANPLLLSVTREIGQQIEERIRAASRPQDLALAMSFMRYTNARRPTVVLDKESLLANTPGLAYVSVSSHVMLWELLSRHRWSPGESVHLELADALQVTARRVVEGTHVHYVAHFTEVQSPPAAGPEPAPSAPPVSARAGVVAVDGPRGSGRATLARELHRRRRAPGAPLEEVAATEAMDWVRLRRSLDSGADVLVRRTEELADRDAGRLAAVLRDHDASVRSGRRSGLLLVTTDRTQAAAALTDTLEQTGRVERTLALAETPERIPGLVRDILERVDVRRRHTLSPTAMQALLAWRWPGNLAELVDVVTQVVAQVGTTVIERGDLPPHLRHVAARRNLTPLEEAERETIVRTLADVGGNRSEAATRLGIGRTTLYRRLRRLAIEVDEGSL